MQGYIQLTLVTFSDAASKIYSSLFEEFSGSVRHINRKRDENVFKMQVAKYTGELKRRLETEANKIMERNPDAQGHLLIALTQRINFYMQEFAQRCKSL